MAFKMKVTSKVNISKHMSKVQSDKFWEFAATEWWKLITPHAPMQSGNLSENVTIRPKEIEYNSPHAHYQYTGLVMGPNFYDPDFGFWSPPGQKKEYTGGALNYSKAKHPLASKEWDKAAAPTKKPDLIDALQDYVDSGRLKLDE